MLPEKLMTSNFIQFTQADKQGRADGTEAVALSDVSRTQTHTHTHTHSLL